MSAAALPRKRPPASLLFVCNQNAIRSPIAEGLARQMRPDEGAVGSAGLYPATYPDGFSVAVMDEVGIDISDHTPEDVTQCRLARYDALVALTAEAFDWLCDTAPDLQGRMQLWALEDPSTATGTREERLRRYRTVRDELKARIEALLGGRDSY